MPGARSCKTWHWYECVWTCVTIHLARPCTGYNVYTVAYMCTPLGNVYATAFSLLDWSLNELIQKNNFDFYSLGIWLDSTFYCMKKCHQDKCFLDKYHCDGFHLKSSPIEIALTLISTGDGSVILFQNSAVSLQLNIQLTSFRPVSKLTFPPARTGPPVVKSHFFLLF